MRRELRADAQPHPLPPVRLLLFPCVRARSLVSSRLVRWKLDVVVSQGAVNKTLSLSESSTQASLPGFTVRPSALLVSSPQPTPALLFSSLPHSLNSLCCQVDVPSVAVDYSAAQLLQNKYSLMIPSSSSGVLVGLP